MTVRPVFRVFSLLVITCLTAIALGGCTFSLANLPQMGAPTATANYPMPPTPTPQPVAAITFQVTIPSPLLEGETLVLTIVDEVTGLALNPTSYEMKGMDTLHYSVTIPFAMNSVIKYRYTREGTLPIPETNTFNQPVRYRMVVVDGPGNVDDVVASWAGSTYAGQVGRLTGQVLDSVTGSPLTDVLVAVGGEQTLSDSNGNFVLENLPQGTHNMVAYALDGSHQTYQQGARVEAGKRTPVKISMAPATLVSVVFTVIVPHNTISSVPIRLAGNLYQLGNTFADLDGGINSVASRMPLLTPMQDGRYTLTLTLPAGADVRYKYTLGDGFWNAEHDLDGNFVLRQLIVPKSDTPVQVQDVISTWQAGNSAPIEFELTAPALTPSTDVISIQFNPYGWTEPIPMWALGDNHWVYELYSPLNMLGTFEYRYCRNDQCGIADDGQTANGQIGRPVATSLTTQDLQDTVNGWVWLKDIPSNPLVGLPVTPRAAGFQDGLEFMPGYDPTWQSWLPLAIQNVVGLGSNLLVLTPSWTVSQASPLVFSPVPGKDPLWADSLDTISRARAANLNVALFPQPAFGGDARAWWAAAPRDPAWWDAWFSRFQAFLDYYADLAAKSGTQMLILGGDWLTPALPGGLLADGTSSGVPADAGARWNAMITDLRGRFKGSLYWALSYPGNLQAAPAFLNNLDGVYLLWSAPLGNLPNASPEDLAAAAGQLLDTDIQPFQVGLQKPLILAAAYASANGSAQASLSSDVLFRPASLQATVNMQAQADIYQGLLTAVNQRSWIGGFVSRGYYPPVGLQDASASVHGKSAADVLWYWYPRFLGTAH